MRRDDLISIDLSRRLVLAIIGRNDGLNRLSPGPKLPMSRFLPPAALLPLMLFLSGCAIELSGAGFSGDKSASFRASNTEALVDETGRCEADVTIDPSLLRQTQRTSLIGRTECEVVRLKGRPSDVSIREEGGHRLVELGYRASGQTVTYVFENNRLVRIGGAA